MLFAVAAYSDASSLGNENTTKVVGLVESMEPDVDWREEGVIISDIDCDGTDDYAISGMAGERAYVGVVLGPLSEKSVVHTVSFRTGEGRYQDSLCEQEPGIEAELLEYDPTEMLGGQMPQGFKGSVECVGLRLGGELCDAIHLYWNHAENKLDWWRL